MPFFFNSKIYNNKYFSLDEPAYSILSDTEGFGIEDAVQHANTIELKRIFIICAGQQTFGDQYRDDYGDILFGAKLTGGNRLVKEEKEDSPEEEKRYFWNGKFSIRTSEYQNYKNTAALLYDSYNSSSLVINILNSRYDWQIDPFYYGNILKYLMNVIYKKIYCGLSDSNKNSVKFSLCGFSRGGILVLRLAEELYKIFGNKISAKISSVVTIDPVINPVTEFDLINSFAKKEKNRWVYKDNDYLPDYFSPDIVPVLNSINGIKYYNIFQRKAWQKQFNAIQKSIGAAVFGAGFYFDDNKNVPADEQVKNAIMQYDFNSDCHTPMMLDKYADWLLKVENFSKV
jgi:hypothetical protein